ncbi:hypothetical protein [uncultured Phascolarctobacterium sp.]|uniref:hypothetical protein n=1 Tax=uncultured Phascolarctobacterium sp. TaxID=512296 RepID=UPI002592A4C8|nr:hypothetical protein [uncultured Phascolarctobacterium sp.]
MEKKAKQKLFELADYYEGRALASTDESLGNYCQGRCDAMSNVLLALDIETEYIDWQIKQ